MTVAETLILASYFFVLLILAVYGWHRYYLVYVYMKHKHEQPVPKAPAKSLQRVSAITSPPIRSEQRRFTTG